MIKNFKDKNENVRDYNSELLLKILNKTSIEPKSNNDKDELQNIFDFIIKQLATKAERDSIKHMQIVFMQNKIGKEFEGVISGVTERGIYVEIIENKCDGMIRVKDMKDDFYFEYQMRNSIYICNCYENDIHIFPYMVHI